MSLRASIDLGTNTCLLLIAEVEDGAVQKTIEDHATIVRLGQGVDKRKLLHPDAMDRALNCLIDYLSIVKSQGIDPSSVIAVATSQARDARNGNKFFEKVRKQTGFEFRILSGIEEAQASFKGAILPGMGIDKTAVIDIGGGSTEFISIHGSQSLDIGSVRHTERFLCSDPVTNPEYEACLSSLNKDLRVIKPWRTELSQVTELLGVAGTITTLAAWDIGMMKFNAEQINSVILTRKKLWEMCQKLKNMTVDERKKEVGISDKRADVLLAGATILWRVMEVLDFPYCRVSSQGLRYGVFSLDS